MPSLNWIGKDAVVNHHKQVPFRLLKCNEKLSVGSPSPLCEGPGGEVDNLLVQGDNLEALNALGDLAGARAAYERALKIFNRFLPEGHPNIKIVQQNLDRLSNDAGGEDSALGSIPRLIPRGASPACF